jgi:hypothetical protein
VNSSWLFGRLCNVLRPPRAAITLAVLIIMAWSSLAHCSEIFDAIYRSQYGEVRTLLKANPALVSSRQEEYPAMHPCTLRRRWAGWMGWSCCSQTEPQSTPGTTSAGRLCTMQCGMATRMLRTCFAGAGAAI